MNEFAIGAAASAIAAFVWFFARRIPKKTGSREGSSPSDSRTWFLRMSDGKVYGPVSTYGLLKWAEQGRVVPGNEVSEDQMTWRPAESVPELEMRYMVVAPGAKFGPFNRLAAEGFLRSNKAPPGAVLETLR